MYRIGFSEDIHEIKEGRKLYLAGLYIPCEFGLLGHSDADVILHAVTEAIFGALSLGDLGDHFPDNDPKYKDISSSVLLKEALRLMKNKGYEINNVDVQVALAKPRLSSLKEKMKESLASLLETELKNVSIKAMSFNHIGPIGEGKAIKASAIVLLKKSK